MRKNPLLCPHYGEKFRCIGPACEDSCCIGWRVSVDEQSYRKYQNVSAGPLKALMDSSLVMTANDEKRPGKEYAAIRMIPSGNCPFLTEERLCRIQAELSEDYLCVTCKTYPRTLRRIDNIEVLSLSLSCPEAARLVLLDPKLLDLNPAGGPFITWDDHAAPQTSLRNFFWVIRDFSLRLALNRNYSLWQRLFLLGVFSRRLEAIQKGELVRSFGAVLQEFSVALNAGSLGSAIEGIRPDLEAQISLLLRFLNMRAGDMARRAPRAQEVLKAFVDAVGVKPGAREADCVEPYQAAYRDVYRPLMLKHPHILENYIVNQVLRTNFPMGDALYASDGMLEIEKTYETLVIQFALIKGVLIGVAGRFGDKFSTDHVIQVVQTLTRDFEHNAKFFADARELLKRMNMNSAQGLTMLVRN